ncbi:phenylalanine--tRNA ligase subunit beta [uncultured Clostridium sp.]|uniref:phenylalanine--tRNA ligase subunit beta n=1 Tax=uncultured Clostridium sp. TaxID=59620 RepID=UPI0025F34909|nr:phenylalanine--tRNA ligase subunit beta [uncultured Clostridium sp.]
MLVPVDWLKDYVEIKEDAKDLGDALTLSGSKVEKVEVYGEEIQNVVTGKIVKITKHPEADKLSICQVDIGAEEPIQIVTAATNMKEQDVVPVALHGSTLHGGLKIKKGKLRGEVSNGMFCSLEELGLAEEGTCHGLHIMDTNTPLGVDIKEAVDFGGGVIEFEITSNRQDCFSVYGIAREVAATYGRELKKLNTSYKTAGGNVNDIVKAEIKDNLCRRYMARAIKNVKIAPSPSWMQNRLNEAGIRPINNIVDITNYVMVELGQPMHAYDRRDVAEGTIIVERAKDNEKFTTLDEVERTLTSEMLTIRDGKGTIGLAGIMGGLDSEVKEDTTEIIFEAANFEGVNIRLTSKELNLRTDASGKFEKDLDPNLPALALDRACALVEELGCGEIVDGTIDIYNEKKEEGHLTVSISWINKFLGTEIHGIEMKRILESLEMPTEIDGDNLKITTPTFRSDMNIKEDVAEEIVRIHGYNNVEATVPSIHATKSGKSEKMKLNDELAKVLIGSGLYESIAYSFVSPKVFDKILIPEDSELRNVVEIKNPLGEDYSIMRTTTIPSMMESLARNYSRNNKECRLFENGKIYIKEEGKELPNEINILTIGLYGGVDYLNLKGVVENILDHFKVKSAKFERETENPSFHPGKTAKVVIGREVIATVGEVHPDVAENYGIDERAFIAVINLDKLYSFVKKNNKYTPLPKFPAVTRDLAVLIDDEVLVADIEEVIKKQGGALVEEYNLFDVYKGAQVPEGKKSVAYSIVYRDPNKTLKDSDVNKVHDKIVRTLEHKLGAALR